MPCSSVVTKRQTVWFHMFKICISSLCSQSCNILLLAKINLQIFLSVVVRVSTPSSNAFIAMIIFFIQTTRRSWCIPSTTLKLFYVYCLRSSDVYGITNFNKLIVPRTWWKCCSSIHSVIRNNFVGMNSKWVRANTYKYIVTNNGLISCMYAPFQ